MVYSWYLLHTVQCTVCTYLYFLLYCTYGTYCTYILHNVSFLFFSLFTFYLSLFLKVGTYYILYGMYLPVLSTLLYLVLPTVPTYCCIMCLPFFLQFGFYVMLVTVTVIVHLYFVIVSSNIGPLFFCVLVKIQKQFNLLVFFSYNITIAIATFYLFSFNLKIHQKAIETKKRRKQT